MNQNIFYDRNNKIVHLRDDNEGWSSFQYYPTYYQLDPNQVNLFDYHNDNHRKLNVNDLFAIGGYDVMKVYHNLFIDQIYYHFTDPVYDEWLIGLDKFVNETILMHHLNTYHIPFNRIPTEREGHSDAIVIR